MKRFFIKFIGIFFAVAFVVTMINANFLTISSLPESAIISYDEVSEMNKQSLFGKFISANVSKENVNVGGEKVTKNKLTFKLFGLIPIKSVDVQLSDGALVYAGGVPMGFSLETDGVILVGENMVETENGEKKTLKSKALKVGDIITKINGELVTDSDFVVKFMEQSSGERIVLTVKRNDNVFLCDIIPEKDVTTNKYKLGIWIKDHASGVGTLTFVNSDNNEYGALGHPITDFETGIQVPVASGKIYDCSLIGITKGQKGKPGELRCLFIQGANYKGNVEKNSKYGVFGTLDKNEGIVDKNLTYKIGSRMCVKPGKAKIISSVSGVREEYDIEIIKASYQQKSGDKSMVIRVTDKRLLNLTGGIVQGMSGSPILQDGKIVGAITHVFLSDPTKGYGVYVDWMLAECA